MADERLIHLEASFFFPFREGEFSHKKMQLILNSVYFVKRLTVEPTFT